MSPSAQTQPLRHCRVQISNSLLVHVWGQPPHVVNTSPLYFKGQFHMIQTPSEIRTGHVRRRRRDSVSVDSVGRVRPPRAKARMADATVKRILTFGLRC